MRNAANNSPRSLQPPFHRNPLPQNLPLVSWESRNGKENGNCSNGLYRDYYMDPVLHLHKSSFHLNFHMLISIWFSITGVVSLHPTYGLSPCSLYTLKKSCIILMWMREILHHMSYCQYQAYHGTINGGHRGSLG